MRRTTLTLAALAAALLVPAGVAYAEQPADAGPGSLACIDATAAVQAKTDALDAAVTAATTAAGIVDPTDDLDALLGQLEAVTAVDLDAEIEAVAAARTNLTAAEQNRVNACAEPVDEQPADTPEPGDPCQITDTIAGTIGGDGNCHSGVIGNPKRPAGDLPVGGVATGDGTLAAQ